MADEIQNIRYFIDEVIPDPGPIGILVTPVYDEENKEPRIDYNVIDMSEETRGPQLDLQKELDTEESLSETYQKECEKLEEEFTEVDLQYMEDTEYMNHEIP